MRNVIQGFSEMPSDIKIKVKGVKLELSDTICGNYRLYKYQEEVLDSNDKFILVSAPTGGGKTLALLLGALRGMLSFGSEVKTGIILYPTKSLIEEQARKIYELLQGLKFDDQRRIKPALVLPYTERNQLEKFDSDIAILPINADILEEISQGRPHGEAFMKLLDNAPSLILTNLDVFYALVKKLYYRGLTLFRRIIHSLGFIGIDEFHLYYGPSLNTLLFLVWILRKRVDKFMFTSATHAHEVINLLKEKFGKKVKHIIARESPDGKQVKYQVDLTIKANPGGQAMRDSNDAKNVIETIRNLLEETEKCTLPKVVVIVNSVVFAETLYDLTLKDCYDVSLIHGFVPRKMRRFDAEVVIGTSAIEVGIDFDAQSVIFEAGDAATFIQRMGRVARKRDGRAVAYVPIERVISLRNSNFNDIEVRYSEFRNIIYSKFRKTPYYTEYIDSAYGVLQTLSNVLALISGVEEVDEKNVVDLISRCAPRMLTGFVDDNIVKLLESKKGILKFFLQKLSLCPKHFKEILMTFYERFGPKGMYPSLPAYFEQYGEYGKINIEDLNKLEFDVLDIEEFSKCMNSRIPNWIHGWDKIVYVKRISPRKQIFVRMDEVDYEKLFILNNRKNFSVYIKGEPNLSRKLDELLDGMPAVCTSNPYDWRASSLKLYGNEGYLVIGYDALVHAWIYSRNIT